MHTPRRIRPLGATLALAALLLAPGPASASPLTEWLGALWETLDLPTVGLTLDPSGGTPSTGSGTPPEDSATTDIGLTLDPNG